MPRGIRTGGSREIGELYEHSIGSRDNERRAVQYGTVSDEQATKLKAATGLDLAGFHRVIDNYAIRHMHEKHGNQATEQARGQQAVTREDIEKIPEIVENFDNAENAGVDDRGMPLIRYRKRFNGTLYYVEEMRSGNQQLAAMSLWKRPSAK